jgi:uncharacterized protein (TIGR02231 family)
MRTVVFFIVLMLAAVNIEAKEVKAKSKIKDVTVFRSGAQIHRKATVYLNKGRNEVVFSELAVKLNPQSIQASGKGDFTILAVYHRYNYLKKIKQNERVKSMQDSVKLLARQIDYINSDISVYNEEAALIKSNKNIGGTQSGLKVADLQAAADFYRKRLTVIYTKTLDLKYRKKELNDLKIKLQKQINTISSRPQKSVSEIVVEVESGRSGNAVFDLQYVVFNAGWNPEYDIRATEINKPVELHARALIFQRTGVDWNNVNLTISSGNPGRSGVIPELYKWYLYYGKNDEKYLRPNSRELEASAAPVMVMEEADGSSGNSQRPKSMPVAKNSADYTNRVQTQMNVKYEISLPYNIPSSGKVTRVKISKYSLGATYRYYCVPKLKTDVFLQARITGWEDLSLIPGNVNIFFEGTYVAKSFLNTGNFSDTLNISLGVDKGIIVKREKIKDKSRKSVMGGKNKITRAWKITVRNTKPAAIHIVMEDQIPLSRNKEIQVELLENQDAAYDEKTGKLTWEFDLSSKSNEEKQFSYQVKYPKDYYLKNME